MTWLSLEPCVGARVARKGSCFWLGWDLAGLSRRCPSVPWGAPGAGGSSPGSCLSLAENGALRNGTEEVLSLEQCPPTKRLKTNPCNNSKEQRVEEDQTRGNRQRELGSGMAWAVHPEKHWETCLGKSLALPGSHELCFRRQKLLWSHDAHLCLTRHQQTQLQDTVPQAGLH